MQLKAQEVEIKKQKLAVDERAVALKDVGMLVQELADARAQLAEAVKDAERYRWIRDNNAVDWEGGALEVPADAPDEVWDVYVLMIDAAVDATLARHNEQP